MRFSRLAVLALTLLALFAWMILPGSAQDGVTITVESVMLTAGESGTVNVFINCPSGDCASFDVTLVYDPAQLRIEDAAIGSYYGRDGILAINSIDNETGRFRMKASLAPGADYGLELLFRLRTLGLAPGLTTVTPTQIAITDGAGNPLDAVGIAGAVSVSDEAVMLATETAVPPTPIPTLTPTMTPTPTATVTPLVELATPVVITTPSPTPGLSLPFRPTPQTEPSNADLDAAIARALEFSGTNGDWEPFEWVFDGMTMALVPVGCFMQGSNTESADESPAHQVCFEEPFWIGKTEVTRAQYDGSLSGSGDLPQNNIVWPDSNAHCESRGFRLPTEAEWEYAARGPDSLIYPWGNTYEGELVVAERDGPEPVGSIPAGASWVGALDMAGNVWEHLADWYDENYYSTLGESTINPQGPTSGSNRVVHGGSWNYFATNSQRSSDRGFTSLTSSFGGTGFRCALSING